MLRTAREFLEYWPTAIDFALPKKGKKMPATRARETFLARVQRMVNLATRFVLEAIAQVIAADAEGTLATLSYAFSTLGDAMGMCYEERQWHEDPDAARVLRENVTNGDQVFSKEERDKIKKTNEQQKEMREMHRNAASTARGANGRGRGGGSLGNNFTSRSPLRGGWGWGRGRRRGFGFGFSTRSAFSTSRDPSPGTSYQNGYGYGANQAKGSNDWRGGDYTERGNENNGWRGGNIAGRGKTKNSSGTRGRGGRGSQN
jgi:hypothetical protein